MQHKGKAVVFESVEEFHEKIDDPNLEVDENSILVLKNCGPKGYPGMAEVGNMRLPQKILKKGIRDMIRISDARMSGTAYGTVILHTSPEAAVKGPLAAVQNGDLIEVDVNSGRLHLNVSDEIIAERLKSYKPILPDIKGGYQKMYVDHVMQADKGADLDFLVGKRGSGVKDIATKLMNNNDLNNKVAIVTGGAQGFGYSMVERFSASGAKVIIWDKDIKLMKQISLPKQVETMEVDVTSYQSVQTATNDAVTKFRSIDILVNNAGIAGPSFKTLEYPLKNGNKLLILI